MEDFQSSGTPSIETIAAEKLGLSDLEREIIVTPKVNLADQQKFWNTPSQWDTDPIIYGNVLDYMKRVDHFLDKTGLSYKELELFLSLKFIDPYNKLFIEHLDLSCNTEQKEIANLDEKVLDRIHRFLRMQKKIKWKFEILDEVISQTNLGNKSLDNNCLIKVADLFKISEKTRSYAILLE